MNKKLFGPLGGELVRSGRTVREVQLYDLSCSPNIIPVIRSRRLRWGGRVARMGGGTVVGKLNRKEQIGIHERFGRKEVSWTNLARDRDG